jgi:hypothetical protein
MSQTQKKKKKKKKRKNMNSRVSFRVLYAECWDVFYFIYSAMTDVLINLKNILAC